MDGDLVERDPGAAGFTRSAVLGVHFCVREDPKLGPMLRLARDPEGKNLLPTPDEARLVAEARVRELEAEIAGRTIREP